MCFFSCFRNLRRQNQNRYLFFYCGVPPPDSRPAAADTLSPDTANTELQTLRDAFRTCVQAANADYSNCKQTLKDGISDKADAVDTNVDREIVKATQELVVDTTSEGCGGLGFRRQRPVCIDSDWTSDCGVARGATGYALIAQSIL